jgi:hypothetical protein
MYETINELKYKINNNISEYSENELNSITDMFLKVHQKYGLGVPIKEKLHKLYHFNYGNDNTPEQFEEFKIRLKSGEFNDFLEENNLHLII